MRTNISREIKTTNEAEVGWDDVPNMKDYDITLHQFLCLDVDSPTLPNDLAGRRRKGKKRLDGFFSPEVLPEASTTSEVSNRFYCSKREHERNYSAGVFCHRHRHVSGIHQK